MLNSVVKISVILPSISNTTSSYLGGPFFRGHAVNMYTYIHMSVFCILSCRSSRGPLLISLNGIQLQDAMKFTDRCSACYHCINVTVMLVFR